MLTRLSMVWTFAWFTTAATAAEPLLWVEAEAAVKRQLVDNAPMNNVNPDALSGGKWICKFLPSRRDHRHRGVRGGDSGGGQVSRLGACHARLGPGLSRGRGKRRRRGGGRQGPGPGPHFRRRQPLLAWAGFMVRCRPGGTDPGQAHAHLVPGRAEGPGSLRVAWTVSCSPRASSCPTASTSLARSRRSRSPRFPIRHRPGTSSPSRTSSIPPPMLDLRSLNEKTAGEHGFIKQSADGDSFVRGDGQPIRFWAAGMRTGQHNMEELRRQARFLAKHGVNAIRVFAMLPPTGEHSKITDVNEADLDSLFMTEAAMKAEGIYTFTGAYWPFATQLQKSWDVTDPQTRPVRRPRLLRPQVPGRLQGLDESPLHAEEPLHGPADRRRSGRGHHPIAERRQSHLVGNHGLEGRRPETVPPPVRRLPGPEARLAGEDPRRLAELHGRQDARQATTGPPGRPACSTSGTSAATVGHPQRPDPRLQGPHRRPDGVPGPHHAPLQCGHGQVSPPGPRLQAADQCQQLADRGPCDDPGRRVLGRLRHGRPGAQHLHGRHPPGRRQRLADRCPATSTPTCRCSAARCKCRPT